MTSSAISLLARRQRIAVRARGARRRDARHAAAELAQLARGGVAQPLCAGGGERRARRLELPRSPRATSPAAASARPASSRALAQPRIGTPRSSAPAAARRAVSAAARASPRASSTSARARSASDWRPAERHADGGRGLGEPHPARRPRRSGRARARRAPAARTSASGTALDQRHPAPPTPARIASRPAARSPPSISASPRLQLATRDTRIAERQLDALLGQADRPAHVAAQQRHARLDLQRPD